VPVLFVFISAGNHSPTLILDLLSWSSFQLKLMLAFYDLTKAMIPSKFTETNVSENF
jgi:hypothetical protein